MKKLAIIFLLVFCSCQVSQMPVRTFEPQPSYYDAMMKNLSEPTKAEKVILRIFGL